MDPILHLSIPVRDLAESRGFYADVLGCAVGREHEDFVDVWFYGMQLTLHPRPDQVPDPAARGVRHFGVTLDRPSLDALVKRLDARGVTWVDRLHTDDAGTPREQTKAKLVDPSGHVIEVKTYADLAASLGPPDDIRQPSAGS